MEAINAKTLRAESRKRTREEMILWLRQVTGKKITSSEFDEIMRHYLPKESYYQKEVMDYIKANYPRAFVWKAAAGPYSRQGIPDVCAIVDGHFFGFEIKRPYIGRLTEIQAQTIQKINEAGGTAAVVSFPHQARDIIERDKGASQDALMDALRVRIRKVKEKED